MSAYDTLIEGGTVVDGTGSPAFRADVAMRDDRIVAVGDLAGAEAARRIDATGLTVAPGFIDCHTHDDGYLLTQPDMSAKVSQGVTSVVIGNCGISLAPTFGRPPAPPMNLLGEADLFRFRTFGGYLDELEKAPASVNALPLVGLTTLRRSVIEDLDKAATPREIDEMRELFAEAIESGALGFSTGLFYPNAAAATPQEVVGVAAPAQGLDLVYATHLRNEGDWIAAALDEAFDIGRRLEARVLLSHHKLIGVQNHGRSRETLSMVHARRMQQKIGLDLYPYTAGSSVLDLKTVADTERVVVSWSEPHPEFAGRDLEEIAAELGLSLPDTIDKLSPAGGIFFMMDEDDVRRILAYEGTMIGSDGLPNDRHPHPRLWGTFSRVLGRYSRELGLLDLPEAVHRMTGMTARFFKLADRGVVAPGYKADLTLFDAEQVRDVADWDAPTEPSAGIDRVLVNGVEVWSDGAHTRARPGQVLRRQTA
ncbi:Amidohydrolase [Oceanicola granulosus HTCC2516]|uniref:Amidohydrolase n=1 Tax=Oceanicola granulosus (strain ATCC BAA-861 / DSM 15982 / KCTC 12143 / HTCC2516) TaxID=314256 RepID=Q2CF33_OCEGH|nr:D-aminoacylase [Oceanicola granulosus]EAR51294.1 Amidohydrolase [Oceanicola granulosus HTCC2516]